jgi:hypothetical protein
MAGVFIITAVHNKLSQQHEKSNEAKKVLIAKGKVGATQFTGMVYNTYLRESYGDDVGFIKSHQTWFVKRGFGKQRPTGPILLCQKLTHKPDQFKASSTWDKNKKTASVYIRAYLNGKPVSGNQLIRVVSDGTSWVIDGPSCYLD